MLKNYVAVYVPSTLGIDKTYITAKLQKIYVREIARKLSESFGGATAIKTKKPVTTNAIGFYKSDAGNLIEERIVIVKAYHDSPLDLALQIVSELARELKATMNQEAVTIETNEGIDFI